MSRDFESQHFGEPEESGTPGVQRYRKARAAIAAWRTMTGKSGFQARGDALAAALEAFLPTYRVLETYPEGDRMRQRVCVTGLESREAAQQWIADTDPAARRVFHIEAEGRS